MVFPATISIFSVSQNLLLSEQWSVIIKGLSKLPKTFDIVVYPTLLTIICDNDGAKSIIARDFDLKVRPALAHRMHSFLLIYSKCGLLARAIHLQCIEEYQNSDMAKKNKMLLLLKSHRVNAPSATA